MLKILVPAVAAFGLLSAAAQTQSAAVDNISGAPAAWHLSQDGEVAKLAYGAPDSDHLALMVTCAAGETDVTVYGDVRPVGMSVPSVTTAFAPDPLSGGDASETVVPLLNAGLGDLSRKGRMTVMSDDGIFQLAATRQERRIVDRFLAYCRSGSS
jgi:hypothetical protein